MIDIQKEQQYAQKLQREYTQPAGGQPSDIVRLQQLDKKVRRPAAVFGWIFGILGALVLGAGMCVAMEVILPGYFYAGIAVGVVGIVMVCVNYPIYRAILRSRRKKYGDEIIALSSRILGE